MTFPLTSYIQKITGDTEESKEQQRQRGKLIESILPGLISQIQWENYDMDPENIYANEVRSFEAWEFLGKALSCCLAI